MPPKDKPKDKGKKKSLKDKKKDEEILKTSRNLKDLLSVYESECKIDNSSPHVELKKYIKACADDGTYCTKVRACCLSVITTDMTSSPSILIIIIIIINDNNNDNELVLCSSFLTSNAEQES